MIVHSETGHMRGKFHKRRKRFAFTVEKNEIEKHEITQIDYILKDVIKDCKEKFLQTFEYRYDYDIKFSHAGLDAGSLCEDQTSSGEVFYITILNDFKLFSSQIDRLHEKLIKAKNINTNSLK